MAANVNQYEGAGTRTVSMFSKLVSQGSSFVMEGVKNLVIKRHVSCCTKVIISVIRKLPYVFGLNWSIPNA